MAFVLYMPSLIVTQLGPYISRVLCFHLAASLPRRPSRSMLCCLFFFRNPLAHSGVRARGPTSLRCSRRDPATISAATQTTAEATRTREGRPISCSVPPGTGSGLPVGTIDAVKDEARDILAKAFGEDGAQKRERLKALTQALRHEWEEGGSSLRDMSAFLDNL